MGDREHGRGLVAIVAVLGAANVVVTVDFFGTNTALAQIADELDLSQATLQWVSLAYLLTLAAPLVAAGRLADLLGARRLLLVGLAVLAVGQTVAAVAPGAGVLITGRAIAGLGASLVTATGLALVAELAPAGRRPAAIGAWSAIGAVGAALGPLIGGIVTQAWGWRWLFGLSAPIGLVVALLLARVRPRTRSSPRWCAVRSHRRGDDHPRPRPDRVRALARTGRGLGGGRRPLTRARCRTALVVRAGRGEGARPARCPRASCGRGRFAVASGVAFVANAAFAVSMYYVALYLQEVDDLSPTETGLVFLAMTIPLMTLAPLLGAFIRRMGRTGVMRTGMAVLVVSFVAFAAISGDHGLGWSIVGLALAGAGQALAFNGSNEAALAAAGTVDSGVASGVVNGGRQVGSLIGLAAAGVLFNPIHHAHLDDGTSGRVPRGPAADDAGDGRCVPRDHPRGRLVREGQASSTLKRWRTPSRVSSRYSKWSSPIASTLQATPRRMASRRTDRLRPGR